MKEYVVRGPEFKHYILVNLADRTTISSQDVPVSVDYAICRTSRGEPICTCKQVLLVWQ